jgi:TPR repeat protein
MAEGVQESGRQDGKRIVACACGQRYRVPIQAVGSRSCTKCGRSVSLATTPDGVPEREHEKLKVFVSYSRKDKNFVGWLSDALQARDMRVFRDLDDILPTEEWWPRIEKLIAATDTVIFVISPDSVGSKLCLRELALCEELNKRVAPIVLREVPGHLLPEALAKLNHAFFTAQHELDQGLANLTAALQLDIGWIREHTRFGELALRWNARGQAGGLLEGDDLIEAESWRDRRPKSAPSLTELQRAFIERSRQAASDRAKSDSDVILGVSLYTQKNFAAALDAWTRAANLGNPAAMTHLGKMRGDGVGVAADPWEAEKWFRKAADLGDLEAMTYLGALHEWGELGEIDLDQATQWYRRAAAAGQLQAMTNLAGVLLRGGKEEDAPEARRLLLQAAEARYPVAMNGMGELSRFRDKDDHEAERWFRDAAERGNAAALVNLGMMYEERPGGAATAAQFYRRAADFGQAEATFRLGELHLRGAGVDQDFSEATRLFIKAAGLGHAGAQAKLAQDRRNLDGAEVFVPRGDFITCPQCNTRVRKSAAERALESDARLTTDPFAVALECPNCHYQFLTGKLRAGEYDSTKPPRGFGFWIGCGAFVLVIVVVYNLFG